MRNRFLQIFNKFGRKVKIHPGSGQTIDYSLFLPDTLPNQEVILTLSPDGVIRFKAIDSNTGGNGMSQQQLDTLQNNFNSLQADYNSFKDSVISVQNQDRLWANFFLYGSSFFGWELHSDLAQITVRNGVLYAHGVIKKQISQIMPNEQIEYILPPSLPSKEFRFLSTPSQHEPVRLKTFLEGLYVDQDTLPSDANGYTYLDLSCMSYPLW